MPMVSVIAREAEQCCYFGFLVLCQRKIAWDFPQIIAAAFGVAFNMLLFF
jgi:hypothetical protein